MAERNRSTLKTFFETGDTPSEAQFIDLIDSITNFIDDSPSANVTGGTSNFTIVIPAGKMLERIVVHADNPTLDALRVGDTSGSTEYAQEDILSGGVALIVDIFVFAITQKTVHVQIANNCTYKYYIR